MQKLWTSCYLTINFVLSLRRFMIYDRKKEYVSVKLQVSNTLTFSESSVPTWCCAFKVSLVSYFVNVHCGICSHVQTKGKTTLHCYIRCWTISLRVVYNRVWCGSTFGVCNVCTVEWRKISLKRWDNYLGSFKQANLLSIYAGFQCTAISLAAILFVAFHFSSCKTHSLLLKFLSTPYIFLKEIFICL